MVKSQRLHLVQHTSNMVKNHCMACGARLKTTGSVHAFPKEEPIMTKWVDFVKENYPHTKSPAVGGQGLCSRHFKEADFTNLNRFQMGLSRRLHIKKEAVPTIRTDTVSVDEVSASAEDDSEARSSSGDDEPVARPVGVLEEVPDASTTESAESVTKSQSEMAGKMCDEAADEGKPHKVADVLACVDTSKSFRKPDTKASNQSRISPLAQILNRVASQKSKGSNANLQEMRNQNSVPTVEGENGLSGSGTTRKRNRKPAKHQLKRVRRESVEEPTVDYAESNNMLQSKLKDGEAHAASKPTADATVPSTIPEISEHNVPFIKPEPSFDAGMEGGQPFPEVPPDLLPPSMEENVSIKKEPGQVSNDPGCATSPTITGPPTSHPNPTTVKVKQEFDDSMLESGEKSPDYTMTENEPKIVNIRTIERDDTELMPQIMAPSLDRAFVNVLPGNNVSQSTTAANGSTACPVENDDNAYFKDVFRSLYAMQKVGKACDLTFCIGVGQDYKISRIPGVKVHKNVFATMSDRIRMQRENVFLLDPSHTYVSLLSVVEYVYTGAIKNIEKLLPSQIMPVCKTALTLDIPKCIAYIRKQRPELSASEHLNRLIAQHVHHFSLAQPHQEISRVIAVSQGRNATTSSSSPAGTVGGSDDVDVYVYCDMSDSTDTSDDDSWSSANNSRRSKRPRMANGSKKEKNFKIKTGNILVKK